MAAGVNSALLDIGGASMATAIAYIQCHSATPNTSGSNECTSARQAVTCTHSAGVITIPSTNFTGIAASGTVAAIGYWSAVTAGTFYGYNVPTGDTTANAAGQFTVNTSTITGAGA